MKPIYKIECHSEQATEIVKNVIDGAGGKFVVEGFALVTDHVFNDLETDCVLDCVSTCTTNLTKTDLDLFKAAVWNG